MNNFKFSRTIERRVDEEGNLKGAADFEISVNGTVVHENSFVVDGDNFDIEFQKAEAETLRVLREIMKKDIQEIIETSPNTSEVGEA